MKVELEIITDRLPTEADGSQSGMVFVVVNGAWSNWHWSSVEPGMHWARIPPPPKPPIDTSLAASISRFTGWIENAIFDEPLGSDCIAVRDAARKWDESQRNGVTSTSHCKDAPTLASLSGIWKDDPPHDCDDPNDVLVRDKQTGKWRPMKSTDLDVPAGESIHVAAKQCANNDPDGVGEGWRLLRPGEYIECGDQIRRDSGRWHLAHDTGLPVLDEYIGRYRRRIKAEQ